MNTLKLTIGFLGAIVLVLGAYIFGMSTSFAHAASQPGVAATQAIATTTTIGPQNNVQLFSAGNCIARIITVQATSAISGAMITFADPSNGDIASTTLSGVKGFWQAASTTVAYDASLYGCGRVFGYAGASTTVTLADFR